jgi:glycosyltransferase involved in cell wall biosynthesis
VKVSIITVVLNNESYIEKCIKSVLSQDYDDIEYIVIDGGSIDGTVDHIRKYEKFISKWISGPDSGIYEAMNKGIKAATGEVVGILNSDDFYPETDVIDQVIHEFDSKGVDSVFADLVYVKRDSPDEIVRYYRSLNFHPKRFAFGWMPAHPTFFVRRDCYERYGLFKTDYKIAADYELLVRFLSKHEISFSYIPRVIINMRTGGVSTKNIKSNWILNNEIIRACRENGIKTNILKVYSKYLVKGFQLLHRPQCISL